MEDAVRFKRAALIVADLERSLAIYRDALGFSLESVKESAADSYSYDIFGLPRSARLRMAALDGPGEQVRTLALIEVTPSMARAGGPRTATVVHVADFDAVLRGLRNVPEAHVLPERELRTHDGKVGREVGVIDPDGHAIVVYHV